MAKTASELNQAELQKYHFHEIIEKRRQENHISIEKRKKKAWSVAKDISQILKRNYGAKKIIVFGSLVYPDGFTQWSDIDLAASGIPPNQFFSAVAAVLDVSQDFKVDLIDLGSCESRMRNCILTNGQEL